MVHGIVTDPPNDPFLGLMLYSHIDHVRNALSFNVTKTNRGWEKNPAYQVQDIVKDALD